MTDMGWIVSVVLLFVVLALIVKIHTLHRSLKEIDAEMKRFLSQDTNVPISVSSEDKYVRKLAGEINVHLLKLRKLRMQYVNGDKELKEAVTNISHDLRTPLTAIYGYIDLIEKLDTDIATSEKEKSDKMSKYMKQIKERTETLKELTEELFTYSVIASVPDLEYEEVNVNRAIEEAMVGFYGAFKEAGIEPCVKISEKILYK